jgi:hypothetical protein
MPGPIFQCQVKHHDLPEYTTSSHCKCPVTSGLILPVVFDVAHDVHGGCHDSDSDEDSVSDLLGEWDSGSWRSRDPCLMGERSGQDPGGGDDQGAGGSGDHVVDELLSLL